MATIEVRGIGVQIGDRLDDGQIVVGVGHEVILGESCTIPLSVAGSFDGPASTRVVHGSEVVTVERPG
jgi:hypothetical protein